ncbi:MAG: ClbS/DfsB family four-helix bundle protein [Bacteroidales bacterium]|nr:ClbS/DfsB family four-helix bundle protein [Bacteroidales bacterium]
MPQPQDKLSLIAAAKESYDSLISAIDATSQSVLETNFLPRQTKAKCTTFEQGENMRDVLMHIYEWQRLQSAFVDNIRKGEPKDFIPDPYRKNYKEMDEVNRQRHQSIPVSTAISLLKKSHAEMMELIDSFSEEELFGKKVFKVTYTTTMGAYFISVTHSPYGQALKRLKSHAKSLK